MAFSEIMYKRYDLAVMFTLLQWAITLQKFTKKNEKRKYR